ncbi:MAG: hypothetical protein ACK51F_14300 [Rhodospirillales bacterium]
MSAVVLDAEAERRRRAKNVAVALTVAGFCLLFFVITIVRMGMR